MSAALTERAGGEKKEIKADISACSLHLVRSVLLCTNI